MSRLGDLIHLERTRRNMTAKQVARLCSLSEKYLLDVEQGRRIIADDQARRILRRIGLEQQTEADFSLDDIAATVDLHTAAPTLPQRPVEDKPRRSPRCLPRTASTAASGWTRWRPCCARCPSTTPPGRLWTIARSPLRAEKSRAAPRTRRCIFSRRTTACAGFRILKDDLLLVVPAHSPIDGAVMLLKWKNHCMARKVKLSGERLMLLSYDRELDAQPAQLAEVTFVGRCARLEASL